MPTLRYYRERKRYTRRYFSKYLELSVESVIRIEKKQQSLPHRLYPAICLLLDITPAQLTHVVLQPKRDPKIKHRRCAICFIPTNIDVCKRCDKEIDEAEANMPALSRTYTAPRQSFINEEWLYFT